MVLKFKKKYYLFKKCIVIKMYCCCHRCRHHPSYLAFGKSQKTGIVIKMYCCCHRCRHHPSYLAFGKSQKTGTAILNDLNLVKSMLKEHPALNFISMRFKELLAEKC